MPQTDIAAEGEESQEKALELENQHLFGSEKIDRKEETQKGVFEEIDHADDQRERGIQKGIEVAHHIADDGVEIKFADQNLINGGKTLVGVDQFVDIAGNAVDQFDCAVDHFPDTAVKLGDQQEKEGGDEAEKNNIGADKPQRPQSFFAGFSPEQALKEPLKQAENGVEQLGDDKTHKDRHENTADGDRKQNHAAGINRVGRVPLIELPLHETGILSCRKSFLIYST